MSQLDTNVCEAAINEITQLSIGEEAPPIYAKTVTQFFQDSTNEPKFNPDEKKEELPGFKRLADAGVSAGTPAHAGPSVCANKLKEKFQVFRCASKILEAQQVHNEMPPSLMLERMNLHSKAILAGEARASSAKVVGANKAHISDFAAAAGGLQNYFVHVNEMDDIIKKDEAIMHMKVLRDFLVCAIDGINGSPAAWDNRKTGEVRRLADENSLTIRVDDNGNMYLLNPKSRAMQLVPAYVEAADPPPAAKKQAVEQASSSSWEKKLKWPENARS